MTTIPQQTTPVMGLDVAAVHDEALEQAVLGGMIRSADTAAAVLEILRPDAFYLAKHQTIAAEIMARLHREPTDAVALAQHLRAAGELDRIGGAGYLVDLLQKDVVGSPAWHAQQLADMAVRRRLEEVAIRARQTARTPTIDVDAAVAQIQADVHEVTSARTSSTGRVTKFHDGLAALIDQWETPTGERGLSTGIGALDDILGRLQPSTMTVVAGRPGMGKTVLVTDIARAVAFRQSQSVAFFSAEMTDTQLKTRIMSAESDVLLNSLTHLKDTGVSPAEVVKLRAAHDRLYGSLLEVDDTPQMTLSHIRTVCRRIQQTQGLDLVVVDYLQLLKPDRSRDTRAVEVGEISAGLKALSRELQVPVVAAAQINRDNAARADKRPQLTDIRESGSIEADADTVVLMHRPSYYDSDDHPGETELIVAKNRSGSTGVVRVAAQLHLARHADMGIPVEAPPR